MVSGCCLFLRLPLPARIVPLLFITVLLRQKRAGRFGKPFVMLKVRSITSDAEMRKAELESFNQMSRPVFKRKRFPRDAVRSVTAP
jgi:lipopolysaccharide/colanic/teichoic acid biosynthesis glycosyltransferase